MPTRVLVVDDDREIVELFRLYLSMHGYEVLTAYCGREAVALVGDVAVDILLCDVRMPDMDGFEVVEAVRESGHLFPILLHTAYDTIDALTRAREMDVQDVIFKPSPPEVVMTKLAMALTDCSAAGSC